VEQGSVERVNVAFLPFYILVGTQLFLLMYFYKLKRILIILDLSRGSEQRRI